MAEFTLTSQSPAPRPSNRSLGLFALVYALGVVAGTALLLIPGGSATIYVPSGMLMGILLLTPRRQWPWWIAAALPVEVAAGVLLFDFPVGLAAGIFIANTLEATTGAALVQRFCGTPFQLRGLKETLALIFLGACVGPLVGGTAAAFLLDVSGREHFLHVLPLWWMGDASGILIAAPLTIVFRRALEEAAPVSRRALVEMTLTLAVTIVVSHFTLAATRPYAYLMLPALLWAALRFGVGGAALAMAALAVSIILHTKQGIGVFALVYADAAARQWNVQLFISVFALTALIVGAITAQRRQALADLRSTLSDTEKQVELRTRELRESEHRTRRAHDTFLTLIRNDPLGVYLVDADLRFVEASVGAQAVFRPGALAPGASFEQLVRSVWPEDFAEHVLQRFRDTLSTGAPHSESGSLRTRHDTGAAEAYHWFIERVVMPDERFGIVCYFYDLSTRARREETLLGVDRRKDDFLATLAHELRNPLGTMRVLIAILDRTAGESDAAKPTLAMMNRQVDQMGRLTDDLLDLGRIRSGKLEVALRPVDLGDMLRRCVQEVRPLLQDRTFEISIPPDEVLVDGDAARLRQVFSNLLDNARKFTVAGGRIDLTLRAHGDSVEVRISDDGEGIPADKLGSIFGMFEQVETARNKARGGLGIGLALAREIVERHNGGIEATSRGLGQGAMFTVRLPRA